MTYPPSMKPLQLTSSAFTRKSPLVVTLVDKQPFSAVGDPCKENETLFPIDIEQCSPDWLAVLWTGPFEMSISCVP